MMAAPTAYRPFESARESPRQQLCRGAEGASPSLESLRPRYRAGEAHLKSGPPSSAVPPKVQVMDVPGGPSWRTSQVPMTDGEERPRLPPCPRDPLRSHGGIYVALGDERPMSSTDPASARPAEQRRTALD